MKGKIDKIWENESKDGKKYWVLSINGKRYSVWDEDYLNGVDEGAMVEYNWKKSGKYQNITELRKIRSEDPYLIQKDEQIVRMSCLKSASELLSGMDMEPEKKADMAIGIARKFHKYVKGDGY